MDPLGVCLFAAMHAEFPCKRVDEMLEGIKRPAISVLVGTFGNRKKCVSSLFEKYPELTAQFHLSNEVARRKSNMYRGELLRGMDVEHYNKALERMAPSAVRSVTRRVKALRTFVEAHKTEHHRLILSTGLEDKFTRRAVRNLIKIIKRNWPYAISRNPVDVRKTSRNFRGARVDFIELHGIHLRIPEPARTIISNDGTDLDFGEGDRGNLNSIRIPDLQSVYRKYREGGSIVLAWFGSSQGLFTNSQRAPKPRRRAISVSRRQSKLVNRLLRRIDR